MNPLKSLFPLFFQFELRGNYVARKRMINRIMKLVLLNCTHYGLLIGRSLNDGVELLALPLFWFAFFVRLMCFIRI